MYHREGGHGVEDSNGYIGSDRLQKGPERKHLLAADLQFDLSLSLPPFSIWTLQVTLPLRKSKEFPSHSRLLCPLHQARDKGLISSLVLRGDSCNPRGSPGNDRTNFLESQVRGGPSSHLLGRARDVAKNPSTSRAAPTASNDLAPMSTVPRLRNLGLLFLLL